MTAKLTGKDEIVNVSKPVHGICGGRYIDCTKLIFVMISNAETGFIYCTLKDGVSLN